MAVTWRHKGGPVASFSTAPTQATSTNRRVTDLGIEVWRLLASRRVTIIALVLVLVAAIIGLFSSAAQPAVDMASPALWAGSGPSFGSRWYTAVGLGALGGLSLVRLVQSWLAGWGPAAPRDAEVRLHEVPWAVEEAWREVSAILSTAGLRLERASRGGNAWLGCARRPGLWGRLAGAFYLGVLLILAAGPVARWWGWTGEPVELSLGDTHAFGPNGELMMRLGEIQVTPGHGGTITRLASTLATAGGGDHPIRLRVDTGRRARIAGLAMYQLGGGPAARVAAHREGSGILQLQLMAQDPAPRSVVRVRFSGRQQEHLLAVPQANMVVRLVHYPSLAARGIPGPVLHVRIERGIDGLSLAEEFLTEGRQVQVADVTLDIGLEYYVIMRAAREPHLPLAALGAAALLAGMFGLVAWPERCAWVAVQAREGAATLCQLAVEPSQASANWFAELEAALVERACGRGDGMER